MDQVTGRDIFELNQQRQEQARRMRAAAMTSQDEQRASAVLRLKGQTGLPVEVIQNDFDYISEQVERQGFDVERYQEESPVWSEFAAENPMNLSVMRADADNLTRIERAVRPIKYAWESGWAVKEMNEIAVRMKNGEETPEDRSRLEDLRKWHVNHDFDTTGFHSIVVANVKEIANILGAAERGIGLAVPSAGIGAVAGAPFAGVGAIPGAVTGAKVGFGVGMYDYSRDQLMGEAYLRYLEMGFSPEDAKFASEIAGTTGGAFESIGLGVLFKKLPGAETLQKKVSEKVVGDILADRTVSQAVKKFSKDFGQTLAAEVTTEVIQESITTGMGEYLKAKNDRDDFLTAEQWVDQSIAVAKETLKATVLIGGVGPGGRLIRDSYKARDAQRRKVAMDAAVKGARDSKTRKQVGSLFNQFLDKVSGTETVYIDVDRFEEYWQEMGESPDEIASRLGVTNLDEAREMGVDVEVPLSQYINQLGATDHHENLISDVRMNPDDMTLREAQQFDSDKEALVEQAMQSVKAAFETESSARGEIVRDITGQLIATDLDPATAQRSAQIMVGIANLAERAGVDPMKFYEQVFSRVERGESRPQRPESVDFSIDGILNRIRDQKYPNERLRFGKTIVDYIKEMGGIKDEGGELAAMDVNKAIPGLVRPQAGVSFDAVVEKMIEDGILPEGSMANDIVPLIRDATMGEPMYIPGTADDAMASLYDRMNELEDILERAGIDIQETSNEEVRRQLEAMDTYEQMDDTDFETLADMVRQLDAVDGRSDTGVDTILGQVMEAMPTVYSEQDFSGVTIPATVRVEGRDVSGVVELDAAVEFRKAKKRENALEALRKCLSA